MTWSVERQGAQGELARNVEGLARVRDSHGRVCFTGGYGRALALFHKMHRGAIDQHYRVICVHGLTGEREDFALVAESLSGAGARMTHFRYPSYATGWDILGRQLSSVIAQPGVKPILIGHSLGCRVIAHALSSVQGTALDIVLIAPPVQPVRWAQRGHAVAPVRSFLGSALTDLAQRPMPQAALADHNLLVIEGKASGTPNDGWLRSEETQLSTPHQRRVISAGHNALLKHPATAAAILDFLSLDQAITKRGGGRGLLASS